MNANKITGTAVVSIADGERIGVVTEILFDKDVTGLFSVVVGTGGVGMLSAQPPESRWIAASDIHAIGPDALTVQVKTVVKEDAPASDVTPLNILMNEKVVSEGGTEIGHLTSLDLDETDFKVRAFEVSPGFFRRNVMIERSDVVTIGPELIIVSDSILAITESEPTESESDSEVEADVDAVVEDATDE